MRKTQYLLLALIVIALAAFASKPSDEKCKEQGSEAVEAYLKKEVNTNFALVNRMIEKTAKNAVSVQDKVLFKTITYSYDGSSRRIGWGAFGMIKVEPGKK
jgi:hypothetical protein